MLENLADDAPLPKLDVLAAGAGLTKYHFHRCFKKATGLTPRDYALQRRQSRQPQALPLPADSGDSNTSTPSLVCDNAVSNGSSVTPDTVQTPDLAFDDWLVAGPEDPALFDNYAFPFGSADYDNNQTMPGSLDFTKDLYDAPMTFPIHYSLADTMEGVLLMAFEDGQVCKLELTATTAEATMSLEQSFPELYYVLVPVEQMQDDQRPSVQQKVRAVVEALEYPNGRTMNALWQNETIS